MPERATDSECAAQLEEPRIAEVTASDVFGETQRSAVRLMAARFIADYPHSRTYHPQVLKKWSESGVNAENGNTPPVSKQKILT
jgi:hypothetical protein